MIRMDLVPCPAAAPQNRNERARRLVQVKFMTLPMAPPAPRRRSFLIEFLSRVIGRLVAARP
jgi:hypothetical protein